MNAVKEGGAWEPGMTTVLDERLTDVESYERTQAQRVAELVEMCRDLRKEAVEAARLELVKNGWQSELGYHRIQFDVCDRVLEQLGESDDRDWNVEVFGVEARA